MSGAKKRAPKRRFKEFLNAGDWEQRKLGNIVDFLDGQRKPLKESERTKGKYPYYGASGIIDYINDYLFDENLVLLSEDGANIIDRNYPVCFIATGKYWVNNHAHVLKVKTGVIDKFICESLERLDYTKFNTGTAQPKLNQDICQKIVITIPNEDEQKCISEFLDRINNIITLHQRKLDKLQATKKALLQEMFPEEGQDKPKRRFKGFTDAWEQRKVNEIFKVTRGQVLAASLTTPEKNRENIYPVYSSQTKDNGLLGYYSEYLFENAITWTTDGANAGTVNFRPGRFYSTNVNGVLINENGYACYAVSEIINKVAYKYVSKVGNPKLMNNVMAEINIMITPDIDELEQISKLIEAYNQYITLHQHKLDKLKNLKQAYLNEMFV